jgi:hypothetical protein
VKAKDIHDAESEWSEPLQVNITSEPVEPELTIDISGGRGVNIAIENTGTTDAEDIAYSISIEGGILRRIDENIHGFITLLPSGGRVPRNIAVFGLGRITITVTVSSDGAYFDESANGFILGSRIILLRR